MDRVSPSSTKHTRITPNTYKPLPQKPSRHLLCCGMNRSSTKVSDTEMDHLPPLVPPKDITTQPKAHPQMSVRPSDLAFDQVSQHVDAERSEQIDGMYLNLEKSTFSPLVMRGGCGVGGICDFRKYKKPPTPTGQRPVYGYGVNRPINLGTKTVPIRYSTNSDHDDPEHNPDMVANGTFGKPYLQPGTGPAFQSVVALPDLEGQPSPMSPLSTVNAMAAETHPRYKKESSPPWVKPEEDRPLGSGFGLAGHGRPDKAPDALSAESNEVITFGKGDGEALVQGNGLGDGKNERNGVDAGVGQGGAGAAEHTGNEMGGHGGSPKVL